MSRGASRWAALAVGLAFIAASGSVARSQEAAPLRIHPSVAPDAPGDTAGMERLPVAGDPSQTAWVGPAVLDLPPASLLTVGLETEADGTATLSLWLADAEAAAFADLTRRSVGRALAVVYEGQVLAAPVVQSEIPNGHVLITGLTPGEGARIAGRIRGGASEGEAPPAVAARSREERTREVEIRRTPTGGDVAVSPPRINPADVSPVAGESPPPDRTSADPPPLATDLPAPVTESTADAAARAFVSAIAQRDWRAAAEALHPDALSRLRAEAAGILRVDRRVIRVNDGETSGTLRPEAVLGRPLPSRSLADLPDLDLGALYLASLDVLGVWGPPGPARTVVGTIADGPDLVHVLLRAEGGARAGVSDVSVVTLRRDAAGQWRPLLTHAQGF